MRSYPFILIPVALLFTSTALHAQEAPKASEPTKEHQWLKQFVGQWETESEAVTGPGQPPIKCKGTMSSRMLGGLWVVSDITGDMGGLNVKAVQTIGYDPEKKQYIGTWVDSMMNHMWHYTGTVDETGKILTLEAEGPDFTAEGKTALYRDVYEFMSKDHIFTTSLVKPGDGEWVTFLTGHMRRVK